MKLISDFEAMASSISLTAARTAVAATTSYIIKLDWTYSCACRPWEARVAPDLHPGSAKSPCVWCGWPLTWLLERFIEEITYEEEEEDNDDDE
jgi:hypothetical protein